MPLWPYLPTLQRIALALAIGLFAGLEREHRGKEAGLRTFAFVALIGCTGSLLGENFALLSIALVGVLIVMLNLQVIRTTQGLELTTSAALILTVLAGALAGEGQTLTPTILAVATAALLAWKKPLHEFSLGLTDPELRSAILLAILAFVVYPVLPSGFVDRWELLDLRAAWLIVILIAGIGFVNYVLLKLYGAKGLAFAAFLGGLVNSAVTVTEMAHRDRDSGGRLTSIAYTGITLATIAAILRNAVLLALLAPVVLVSASLAFILMLGAGATLLIARYRSPGAATTVSSQAELPLSSPFSITSALKYGLMFLVLQVAGVLAQRSMGQGGFYVVSLLGGLISGASTVASAALLAVHGTISAQTAAVGSVLGTAVAVLVNVVLTARISRDTPLTKHLGWTLGSIAALGLLGVIVQDTLIAIINRF